MVELKSLRQRYLYCEIFCYNVFLKAGAHFETDFCEKMVKRVEVCEVMIDICPL